MGTVYCGSKNDKQLFIGSDDSQILSAMDVDGGLSCAALMKNDTLLCTGCLLNLEGKNKGLCLIFNLEKNPKVPEILHKINTVYDVYSVLPVFDMQFLCGEACLMYENIDLQKKESCFQDQIKSDKVTIQSELRKMMILEIKKHPSQDLFAMGTYKGVFIMSIKFKQNVVTHKGRAFLNHEIRAVSFIDHLSGFIAPQKMAGASIVEFNTEKSLTVFKELDIND